jgi:hypothetical protein
MPTIPSSDVDSEEPEIDMDLDIPPPLTLLLTKSTPLGPRSQPPQSVLKNAMALRRMNSEANHISVGWDPEQRESRQYVRMGREASPLLPWIGDVETGEDSVGNMKALFDFGFAAADGGAENEGGNELPTCRSALDEIDLAIVERKLDGALAGFEPGSDDTDSVKEQTNDEVASRQVWEHGDNFEQDKRWAGFVGKGAEGISATTPKKRDLLADGGAEWKRRSVQMTPRSLYDCDGFLRGT